MPERDPSDQFDVGSRDGACERSGPVHNGCRNFGPMNITARDRRPPSSLNADTELSGFLTNPGSHLIGSSQCFLPSPTGSKAPL